LRSGDKELAKKRFAGLLASLLLATVYIAAAQEEHQVPLVGFLTASPPSVNSERVQAFLQGLHDLGYVDGQNLKIAYRSAEGRAERLPQLAAELVRLKADVIVTAGPTPTGVLKHVTQTIPVVMTHDPDPVGNGFVASLARPGGNITGLSSVEKEISGKQLELLKEAIPRLTRVAVLGTSNVPGSAQELEEIELAAKGAGAKIQFLSVLDAKDIETAFRATKGQADALLVGTSRVLISHRKLIVALAAKYRLPAIYIEQEFVDAGGLMSYAPSIVDLYRRAAAYVDKILKGAKPADLPVEQPTKFEFVVNLKAAKQIGLTIPPNVLARADRVIR